MKKKVNAHVIASELAEGSAFFRQAREQDAAVATVEGPPDQSAAAPAAPAITQATSHTASQPTDQSTDQSTDQRPVRRFDTSPILGRPKSFYITGKQDK